MAVPTTNVGLSDIQTEFGGSNPISLSEYYLGGPLVSPATPAPNGPIPSSGQIAIGQFRGAGAVISFDYLVVAGGGGGGTSRAGAGGAGGHRTSFPGGTKITLASGTTPITVGSGGSGGNGPAVQESGTKGQDSVFSTITSTGGGLGRSDQFPAPGPASIGGPGGSGGGGVNNQVGGTGNSPPTSPSQGNPGGFGFEGGPNYGAGGGGGAGAAGTAGNSSRGGPGGNGLANSITGSPVTRAGGGGGGQYTGSVSPVPQGGSGGGGNGGNYNGTSGQNGTAATGGGGGGGAQHPNPGSTGGNGGSGVVLLRAPGPAGPKISVAPGTNTKTTVSGDTLLTFTVPGSFTIS